MSALTVLTFLPMMHLIVRFFGGGVAVGTAVGVSEGVGVGATTGASWRSFTEIVGDE